MKKFLTSFRTILISASLLLAMIALPVMVPEMAGAQANEQALCEGSGGTWAGGKCTTPGNGRTVTGTLRQVINIIIFIVGAVSVLMVVIGGFRYAVSAGDQSSITAAKNTILYAIVGIVVAFASYAIVDFVLNNIGA